MKLYIRAAKTIQQLKQQDAQGMDIELFDEIVAIDPTSRPAEGKGGKYCPWLFRQYKKGNLSPEKVEYSNLRDDLEYFNKQGRRFDKGDINQYGTVQEFMDTAREVATRPLTEDEQARMLKKSARKAGDQDKKLLVEDDEFEVWTPLTYAGSISLARQGGHKAEWCTAYEGNDHYYRSYTSRGPLYIFLNKTDPDEKYQTHFGSDDYNTSWFFDIDDRELGKEAFYKFMDEHPIIADFFKIETIDGVQFRAGAVVGFVEDADTIRIPDGVDSIATQFPHGVREVYLSDSVTSIPARAFRGCQDLVRVKLSNSLTAIPDNAFENCTALTELHIPDSVTSYGGSAFSGCSSLRYIEHSRNLLSVGQNCFADCTELDDFELPDTVTQLGSGCFTGVGFSSITLPSGITELNAVFSGDQTIRHVDLNNVVDIQTDAFRKSGIEEIDLSKVKVIRSNAFRMCENLRRVTLNPDGVTIGSGAFGNCPNLEEVTIPAGSVVGLVAFNYCPNLTLRWEMEDKAYDIDDIKKLVCDASCTELIESNEGIIPIETFQGDFYDVQ